MSNELAELSAHLGDRYIIERELGRGGMGAVFLARDRRLDRPVALKVLPSEYAVVPDLRERFLRETRLAAGFSHPNIVPVFAIEETDEVLAFAMGYVEGESLAARVARDGPLGRREAVRLLQDVGYALAYAHGRGVVHRDIKPDNIMIERATSRALVMDFGIARAITPVADKPGLTRVGEVVGTPEYMSPEQATGDAVDGRADLYSLGLVAWFALTGRAAVTGDTTQRILVKQLTETIPSLAAERSDLPATLVEVVDRCCAKEADDRFQSAGALVEALDAAQLATPDIPVAIRLLAVELGGAAMRGLGALALICAGIVNIRRDGNGNLFTVGLIVAGTAWVGLVSALRDARRLCSAGYTVAELQRLLGLTLSEKDEERARRAADPTLARRRRVRVRIAVAVIVCQISAFIVLRMQHTSGDLIKVSGPAGAITVFAALVGTAAAYAVLLSSPFRRSWSERVFHTVWLGRLGYRILALAGGRAAASGQPARKAEPVHAPAKQTTPSVTGLAADVNDLRQRVEALERRR